MTVTGASTAQVVKWKRESLSTTVLFITKLNRTIIFFLFTSRRYLLVKCCDVIILICFVLNFDWLLQV